jgi:hypothetical protein
VSSIRAPSITIQASAIVRLSWIALNAL